MSSPLRPRLFERLPAVMQMRDGDAGPLRALLDVVDTQLDVLTDSIDALYDNLFIDTCDPWVIPYLGDLVGDVPLPFGLTPLRGDVARTLAHRARKGSLRGLALALRDASGFPVLVVPYLERTGWAQHLAHRRAVPARDSTGEDPRRSRRFGSAPISDAEAMDLAGTPFEPLSRRVDVRPVGRGGLWGVRKVGIFAFRAVPDRLDGVTARKSAEAVRRYGGGPAIAFGFTFDPAGARSPLFHEPPPRDDLEAAFTEADFPAPIRLRPFAVDLQAQHDRVRAGSAPGGVYYGADLSISREAVSARSSGRDRITLSATEIVPGDLSAWEMPQGTSLSGLLGAPRPTYGGVGAPAGRMRVEIGTEGPFEIALDEDPPTIARAAQALERAVIAARSAGGIPGGRRFQAARALALGDRIFLASGRPGFDVKVTAAGADPTADRLGLLAPGAAQAWAAIQRSVPVPGSITAERHALAARVGRRPSVPVIVSGWPASPADAADALRIALRAAGSGAAAGTPEAALAQAEVTVLGDGRLLVMAGPPYPTLTFGPTADDSFTAARAGLASCVVVDPRLGRLAFDFGDEPAEEVKTTHHRGRLGAVGGGAYDRPAPQGGERRQTMRIGTTRNLLGPIATALLMVAAGLSVELLFEDSATYFLPSTITLEGPGTLIFRAENGERPLLQVVDTVSRRNLLNLHGAPGKRKASIAFEGVWLAGGIYVAADAVARCDLRDSTFIPGRRLLDDGGPALPDASSIRVAPNNEAFRLSLQRSIVGPLRVPTDAGPITIEDSVVVTGTRAAEATQGFLLVSRPLASIPTSALGSAELRIDVGDRPSVSVTIALPAPGPASLADVATAVDAALRAPDLLAQTGGVRALALEGSIALLSPSGEPIAVEALSAAGRALGLHVADARGDEGPGARLAVVSAPIAGPLRSGSPPLLSILAGLVPSRQIALAPGLSTPEAIRASLEAALRAELLAPAFSRARVRLLDGDRLVVVPGEEQVRFTFKPPKDDVTTIRALRLGTLPAALAGSAGGEVSAPSLRVARSTFLGDVRAVAIVSAEDTLFDGGLEVEDCDEGCIRASYVRPHQKTPQRTRCQPDGALAKLAPAEARDPAAVARLVARVRPVYLSTRFGEVGAYVLSSEAPDEIRRGTDGGGEMGAFGSAGLVAGEARLEARLGEQLPVGLSAALMART